MLAALLSVLALGGGSTDEPLWVSTATPYPGTTYRAMSWSGGGGLDCTGVLPGGRVIVSSVQYEGKTGVCVLSIPPNAAGKQLQIMYGVTTAVGGQETVTHGRTVPRLIGAAPVPRAGRPFLVYLHPADAELFCEGGTINGKRVPVRYEPREGTTACLLLIPRGTAGESLLLNSSYRVTTRPVLSGYNADGNAIYSLSTLWADAFTVRLLIRR